MTGAEKSLIQLNIKLVNRNNAMNSAASALMSAETMLDNLATDSNPNKDALKAIDEILQIVLRARCYLEEVK